MTKSPASVGPSSSRKVLGFVAVMLVILGLVWWLRAGQGAGEGEGDGEAERGSERAASKSSSRSGPDLPKLASEAKASISGTVRTRGGGPIAGAQVCVWADGSELRGLGDGLPTCTRSEHDGHYRLDGLWPVGVFVEASAAEHRPARWRADKRRPDWRPQVVLRPGEVREGVDFELVPGGSKLAGVVKDISGGEIEGAIVMARDTNHSFGRAAAISDERGRFELWTATGVNRIVARAPGYAESTVDALSPSSTAELFLTPESVLVGRVVHAQTGEPVGDLTVTEWDRGAYFDEGDGAVRSDADGNFRITGLHPGAYKPAAKGDNFYGVAATQVHLGLGQSSEPVEIRVHPVALVEGQIVMAGSHEGCPDASLTLSHVETKEKHYALGDSEGRVIVRALLPGEYEVSVFCFGMVSEAEYPHVEVGGENIVGQIWEVREGLAIRGVVVDAEGTPIPDMQVSANMKITADNARAQASMAFGAASEDDGQFELAGLLPGSYELFVYGPRPSLDEPMIVELEPGADRNDVRIELPATGSIRGRVVDDRGEGQANVAVTAGLLGAGWRSSDVRTDDAGNFTLEHVRVGEVRVRASGDRWGKELRRPGTSDDDDQGEIVSVSAGATVEVELVVESRTGVIRGRVFDESGAPVDDAFVHAERIPDSATASKARSRNAVRWDWSSTPHLSETDGSFEIDGLSEGTYVVRAHRKGGGEAIAEDVALGSSVDLTIAPTGVLAGIVRVEGGAPPERFTIVARDAKAGLYFSDRCFRTEGRWELTELPAGSYELSVDSPAGNGELSVELASGGVQDKLEIVLTPRVTIKGRVVDADTREPIPGLKAMVSSRAGGYDFDWGRTPGPEVSDEQGNFVVENAATGRVQLTFMPRSFNMTGGYSWTTLERTIEPEPAVQDLGDIPVIRDRLDPGQKSGDLGFELTQSEPGVEPEDRRLSVGLIRPGGPADGTGLAVGDVIEAVDGKSVLGADSSSYWKLTRAPAGTRLELTIAGDKSVEITLGPPRE